MKILRERFQSLKIARVPSEKLGRANKECEQKVSIVETLHCLSVVAERFSFQTACL